MFQFRSPTGQITAAWEWKLGRLNRLNLRVVPETALLLDLMLFKDPYCVQRPGYFGLLDKTTLHQVGL